MHEDSKLKEAHYFCSQMLAKLDDRQEFLFNLSAFLSAARSVLQYALKEAKSKDRGKEWYNGHIGSSRTLSFFKHKRDINVHIEPVTVSQHTLIEMTLHISESFSLKVIHPDGNIVSEYHSEPEAPPRPAHIPPKISHRFTFPDWEGKEDVPGLCQAYFAELERVVADGQAKGFLTE